MKGQRKINNKKKMEKEEEVKKRESGNEIGTMT